MTDGEFKTKLALLGAELEISVTSGNTWIELQHPLGSACKRYLVAYDGRGYTAIGVEGASDPRYYRVLSRPEIITAVINANATMGDTVTDQPKTYTWV
jgi:hypothetical protein